MKRRINIVLIVLISICAHAQVHVRTLGQNIKTLKVERLSTATGEQVNNGMPERPFLILQNGSIDGSDEENTMRISFDELSHDVHFYSYTLLHLDHDGQESNINSGEYLRGFTTADISNYSHSLNTSVNYTHYEFDFPNADMQITASGKYRLLIYEDNDRGKQAGYVDFVVVEPIVGIETRLRYDTQREINGRFQQLDIDINAPQLGMRNTNEYYVVVEQNNRIDNSVTIQQPTYVHGDILRYQNLQALIFEGGNEYRHFDCFSTYLAGTNIDRITYMNGAYHAILFYDPLRTNNELYIHEFDADGQFRVNAERTQDMETEAEYMWVHWTLPGKPRLDGCYYIGGDIYENSMTENNRMLYDNEYQCYYHTALVKQGGYDYQYWFRESEKKTATTQLSEGSHWETDNRYTVYVYYRPFGSRYDRLVGLKCL